MANSKVAGLICGETYANYSLRPDCSAQSDLAIWNSGIISQEEMFGSIARGKGFATNVPYYEALEHFEDVDYTGVGGSGDTQLPDADPCECDEVLSTVDRVIKYSTKKCFSESRLENICLGCDEMTAGDVILETVGGFLAKDKQSFLMASLRGIYNSEVALGAGVGNYVDVRGNTAPDNVFTFDALNTAAFNSGANFGQFDGIIMHSQVAKNVIANNVSDYCCETINGVEIRLPIWNGYRVIVSDHPALMVTPGTPGDGYISILFRNGTFGYGEGCADPSYHPEFLPCNKEFQHYFYDEFVIHPKGYCNNLLQGAANDYNYSPNKTQLATAGTWTRSAESRCLGLQFIASM